MFRVVPALTVHLSKFPENFRVARVIPQPFPQKLLGFVHFSQPGAEPIGSHHISLRLFRVQRGRQPQPRQDFPHLGGFRLVPGRSRAALGSSIVQMRVGGRKELAAEGVDPVARFSQETGLVALVMSAHGARLFGHVRRLEGLAIVENGWVETTVEVSVRFGKKVAGKKFAPVTQGDRQNVG